VGTLREETLCRLRYTRTSTKRWWWYEGKEECGRVVVVRFDCLQSRSKRCWALSRLLGPWFRSERQGGGGEGYGGATQVDIHRKPYDLGTAKVELEGGHNDLVCRGVEVENWRAELGRRVRAG
jgi:hypothetical protein